MNILLTGGSGFLGTPLIAALTALGHRCIVTTRTTRPAAPHITWLPIDWDAPTTAQRDALVTAVTSCQAVINLAGASVGEGRWTPARKAELVSSRMVVTRTLVDAMSAASACPKTFLSASGTGYYGSCGDAFLTESSPAGRGFLAQMAIDWEAAAQAAAIARDVRVVRLRIGVILAHDARILQQLVPLFRCGLGGPVGGGRQWMSWIHRDDTIALILYLLTSESISGPVNIVAPHPVTNAEFTQALAHTVHRPAIIPAPAFALRAILGERAALVLDSQRAIPQATQQTNFEFRYPHIQQALAACV